MPIVQAVFGLIYLCAGSAKLLGADIMVEAFDATGLGQSLRVCVGVLEICGGLCLFVPRASIYAAVTLGCTIVGILGAAVGHLVDEGDQGPFDAPRLTATPTSGPAFHGPQSNAGLWQVPVEIRPHRHIEG